MFEKLDSDGIYWLSFFALISIVLCTLMVTTTYYSVSKINATPCVTEVKK